MKKLVAFIISLSLILTPCFAFADTASGSALTFDDQWLFSAGGIKPIEIAAIEANDIKATTANTDVFINGYAMPSNMNFYYFGSGSQATTFSNAYSQLPYLFQAITYSIAYSTQNLNTKIQTALTTLNTAVSGISTGVANINTSSGNTATNTSNIYTRLGTINSNIGNLKTYTDGVETTLTDILTAIQNQSLTIPQSLLDDVDSLESNKLPSSIWQGYIMPASDYNYETLDWYRVVNRTHNSSISGTTENLNIRPWTKQVMTMLNSTNQMTYWDGLRMVGYVVGSDYPERLIYRPDRTTYSLNRRSLWDDIRSIGSNLSNHLSRLDYVLANDDEISAREAASANTAAAVSNVISSSGSGSARPTDISGVADLKSSTTDSISSGVSASTIFSQTGSGGHAWDWFSQTVADELSAPSRRSDVRSGVKSNGFDTPMLDAYRHDLEEAIGFKLSW